MRLLIITIHKSYKVSFNFSTSFQQIYTCPKTSERRCTTFIVNEKNFYFNSHQRQSVNFIVTPCVQIFLATML